jgi:ectoine hydroxylase-related dioxygenase (phytanoyl-CoA dioxygenase family)
MRTSPSPQTTAPSLVDDAAVQRYIDDGFLIVPGLIDADEVDELRRELVRIARGEYPAEGIEPVADAASDEDALRRFLCVHNPHYVCPPIERYARHKRVCGVLARIVAAHLPHWDGSVKCVQSMMFVKGPGDPGQAWHQDEIYIPTRDRSLCGAWIALDPATVANGCLRVLPGSHRSGYLYPQRPHDNSEFDFAEESIGFDESGERPVELSPGDAVFFNGHLLHRSRRNRSEIYRRALVCHYMNAWSLLPWELRDGERVATADRRNVIPVAGVDPYAWKGYEQRTDVWLRPRT